MDDKKNSKVAIVVVMLIIAGIIAYNLTYAGVSKDASKPEESLSYTEISYRQGISYIKKQQWEKAAVKLVYLEEGKYKDSATLQNYATAKEQYGNEDFGMADLYMCKISNDYAGLFKDEVLAFKQECKQRNLQEHLVSIVAAGVLYVGMPQEKAESLMGKPSNIKYVNTEYGNTEQWCYPGCGFLYFNDGILTSFHK